MTNESSSLRTRDLNWPIIDKYYLNFSPPQVEHTSCLDQHSNKWDYIPKIDKNPILSPLPIICNTPFFPHPNNIFVLVNTQITECYNTNQISHGSVKWAEVVTILQDIYTKSHPNRIICSKRRKNRTWLNLW